MPTDDEKTTVEVKDGAAEESSSKKGGNKLFLFGGIGLGAVVIGVVLAIFVVKPMMSDTTDNGDAETELVEDESSGGHGAPAKEEKKHKPKKKKSSHGSGEESEAVVYSIRDIVVNPAGTGGSRFLPVSFGFDLESGALAEQFESREPIVRDALITILSSKTVAQLTDTKQKEIIRYQIKKRVSQLLDTDELAGVYYTDFVLQ